MIGLSVRISSLQATEKERKAKSKNPIYKGKQSSCTTKSGILEKGIAAIPLVLESIFNEPIKAPKINLLICHIF